MIAALCAATIIVNHTDSWTPHDHNTMVRGQIRCGAIYKESPCLVKIIKVKEGAYRAICSPPPKERFL